MNLTLEIHHRETFEKETKLIYKAGDVQAYGHRYVIKFETRSFMNEVRVKL
jgi:hypothetical protein